MWCCRSSHRQPHFQHLGTYTCNLLLSSFLLEVCASWRITIFTIIWWYHKVCSYRGCFQLYNITFYLNTIIIITQWYFMICYHGIYNTIRELQCMNKQVCLTKRKPCCPKAISSRDRKTSTKWQTLFGPWEVPWIIDVQWPRSNALTSWNPKGGVSTVAYLMVSPCLLPS